jgi:hypothetical protein
LNLHCADPSSSPRRRRAFSKAHNDRQMLLNVVVGCLVLHDLVDHFLIAIHVYKQRNGYNSAAPKET